MTIPRPEYPRPQFVRDAWMCLNGVWQFEIDHADTGFERGLVDREFRYARRIMVPFCPESALSGVGHEDFMNAVWYRRTVKAPASWRPRRVLLHFQACDYDTTVWVNGRQVGRHRGGMTPFSFDLGPCAGERIAIVVRARDLKQAMDNQPAGKQSSVHGRHGCHYTRTTGIWQTVWLEPVPAARLDRPRITPDVANSRFRLALPITGPRQGCAVRATLADADGPVATAQVAADDDFAPQLDLPVPKARRKLWAPGEPNLYDIQLELLDPRGRTLDRARTYAGLRSVTIDGKAVRINGQAVFQRLVLDQGFYPDGIWTAPSDAALRRDIDLSQAAGFNGARLHQKVFEERFLYHADRLGYLVWGEFGDWGIDRRAPQTTVVAQWLEALNRDYSHPCIVGWCPLNETRQQMDDSVQELDDLTLAMFLAAKAHDTTRPVLDASGYSHRLAADVYDSHDYNQDPASFAAQHKGLARGKPFVNPPDPNVTWSVPYGGQPYFVSEFGGIWWNPAAARRGETSWGYGSRPRTVREFYKRFESLCRVLLDNPAMFGYCYTQLTDVFQEQNGIYYFDRRRKFDMNRIRRAQCRQAAIERSSAGRRGGGSTA